MILVAFLNYSNPSPSVSTDSTDTAPVWWIKRDNNGTATGTNPYKYKIRVEEVSTDITSNSGVYNLLFQVCTNGWGYESWGFAGSTFKYSTDNSVDVDATAESTITAKKTVKTSTYVTVASVNGVTLSHKDDGTLAITVEVKYGVTNSGYNYLPWRTTVKATFTATRILRDFKVYVNNGTEWKIGTPYVCTGTEWKKANISSGGVYVNNGTEWKVSSIRG